MYQRIELIGNLGAEPELRYTSNQNPVATLSVATSDSRKDKNTNEWITETEWHRVVVWGLRAEWCGISLKKGSKVFIEGKVKTRSFENKQGQKQYTTEVIANTVKGLDAKAETNDTQTTQQQEPWSNAAQNPYEPQIQSGNQPADRKDIPF